MPYPTVVLQYIKENKLQDPLDPTSLNTDEHLKALFGPEDKLKFAGLAQKLTQHLSPAPPIVLEHRIKLKGKKQTADVCYDIMVSFRFVRNDGVLTVNVMES